VKALLALAVLLCTVFGADPALPTINLSLNSPTNAEQLVNSLNVLLILTALALAPSLIFMMTSFLRLIIVFSFLRQAMGTQQMPPSDPPRAGDGHAWSASLIHRVGYEQDTVSSLSHSVYIFLHIF